MKVLVVGSGAREHAIVWKLVLSNSVDTVYCAPGNGGTAMIAQNLDMGISSEPECDQLAGWAFNNRIDLVIVGPEAPLMHGLVDTLMVFGIKVFGPTRAAARLEWSKAWARDFMRKHDIPSPSYEVVEGLDSIRAKLQAPETSYPLVLKADGLAAGKGAAVVTSAEEALEAVSRMLEMGALPEDKSAVKVVLEEYLNGIEVSALAFVDGSDLAMMPPACDYKRLQDGDAGPLTGGMGAYTPTKYITSELWDQIKEDVMVKTVQGMTADGVPYRGVLYAGLMLTESGPKVLEFNCRMGDPEAQVLLPLLETPLEDIALAVASGDLARAGEIQWSNDVAVGVVLASEGYPTHQAAAHKVSGLANLDEGVLVFHAGTQLRGAISVKAYESSPMQPSVFRGLFGKKNRWTTGNLATDFLSPNVTATGGRLLTIVAMGRTFQEARDRVYSNIPRINIDGVQYRTDIAARELTSELKS